jgi:hypothetical protein
MRRCTAHTRGSWPSAPAQTAADQRRQARLERRLLSTVWQHWHRLGAENGLRIVPAPSGVRPGQQKKCRARETHARAADHRAFSLQLGDALTKGCDGARIDRRLVSKLFVVTQQPSTRVHRRTCRTNAGPHHQRQSLHNICVRKLQRRSGHAYPEHSVRPTLKTNVKPCVKPNLLKTF